VEKTITKDILRKELYAGHGSAGELLYSRYGGMLFGYVLQFLPDKEEAAGLLVEIFARLTPQLHVAFESSMSIYCWLQVESRRIVLDYIRGKTGLGEEKTYYLSLLQEASSEHQWIFRELFIFGRKREDLAARSGRELAHISRMLRECLFIIRKNIG
jgi:hypothetical protein